MKDYDAARILKDKANAIVCLAPDVCLTPRGSKQVKVPYMVITHLSESEFTVPNVLMGGEEAFTLRSRIQGVTGNESGVGGGVQTGTVGTWCRPQTYNARFIVNGEPMVQDGSVFEMCCDGPEGPHNTLGKLSFEDNV